MSTISVNRSYHALSSAYDSFADVLFVRVGDGQRTLGVDTPGGFVLEYSVPDHKLTGVTVVGFRRRFPDFEGCLHIDAAQPFDLWIDEADNQTSVAYG